MRLILNLLFLFIPIFCFSQDVSDIGKMTYYEVKKSQRYSPCEETPNEILTYCVQGGHKISFFFRNRILFGIANSTAHSTRYSAERDLDKNISDFQRNTGIVPIRESGNTIFASTNSPILSAHKVEFLDGTYFYINLVQLVK